MVKESARVPPRCAPGGGRVTTPSAIRHHGPSRCKTHRVDLAAFDALATSLAGVRRTTPGGAARWSLHGRLVARQLDDTHVVIRAELDVRDSLVEQYPEVFTVPRRFVKHMMVVADLTAAATVRSRTPSRLPGRCSARPATGARGPAAPGPNG